MSLNVNVSPNADVTSTSSPILLTKQGFVDLRVLKIVFDKQHLTEPLSLHIVVRPPAIVDVLGQQTDNNMVNVERILTQGTPYLLLREIDNNILRSELQFDKKKEATIRTVINSTITNHVYCTPEELKSLKSSGVISGRTPRLSLITFSTCLELLDKFSNNTQNFKNLALHGILITLLSTQSLLGNTLMNLKSALHSFEISQLTQPQQQQQQSSGFESQSSTSALDNTPHNPPWSNIIPNNKPFLDFNSAYSLSSILSNPTKFKNVSTLSDSSLGLLGCPPTYRNVGSGWHMPERYVLSAGAVLNKVLNFWQKYLGQRKSTHSLQQPTNNNKTSNGALQYNPIENQHQSALVEHDLVTNNPSQVNNIDNDKQLHYFEYFYDQPRTLHSSQQSTSTSNKNSKNQQSHHKSHPDPYGLQTFVLSDEAQRRTDLVISYPLELAPLADLCDDDDDDDGDEEKGLDDKNKNIDQTHNNDSRQEITHFALQHHQMERGYSMKSVQQTRVLGASFQVPNNALNDSMNTSPHKSNKNNDILYEQPRDNISSSSDLEATDTTTTNAPMPNKTDSIDVNTLALVSKLDNISIQKLFIERYGNFDCGNIITSSPSSTTSHQYQRSNNTTNNNTSSPAPCDNSMTNSNLQPSSSSSSSGSKTKTPPQSTNQAMYSGLPQPTRSQLVERRQNFVNAIMTAPDNNITSYSLLVSRPPPGNYQRPTQNYHMHSLNYRRHPLHDILKKTNIYNVDNKEDEGDPESLQVPQIIQPLSQQQQQQQEQQQLQQQHLNNTSSLAEWHNPYPVTIELSKYYCKYAFTPSLAGLPFAILPHHNHPFRPEHFCKYPREVMDKLQPLIPVSPDGVNDNIDEQTTDKENGTAVNKKANTKNNANSTQDKLSALRTSHTITTRHVGTSVSTNKKLSTRFFATNQHRAHAIGHLALHRLVESITLQPVRFKNLAHLERYVLRQNLSQQMCTRCAYSALIPMIRPTSFVSTIQEHVASLYNVVKQSNTTSSNSSTTTTSTVVSRSNSGRSNNNNDVAPVNDIYDPSKVNTASISRILDAPGRIAHAALVAPTTNNTATKPSKSTKKPKAVAPQPLTALASKNLRGIESAAANGNLLLQQITQHASHCPVSSADNANNEMDQTLADSSLLSLTMTVPFSLLFAMSTFTFASDDPLEILQTKPTQNNDQITLDGDNNNNNQTKNDLNSKSTTIVTVSPSSSSLEPTPTTATIQVSRPTAKDYVYWYKDKLAKGFNWVTANLQRPISFSITLVEFTDEELDSFYDATCYHHNIYMAPNQDVNDNNNSNTANNNNNVTQSTTTSSKKEPTGKMLPFHDGEQEMDDAVYYFNSQPQNSSSSSQLGIDPIATTGTAMANSNTAIVNPDNNSQIQEDLPYGFDPTKVELPLYYGRPDAILFTDITPLSLPQSSHSNPTTTTQQQIAQHNSTTPFTRSLTAQHQSQQAGNNNNNNNNNNNMSIIGKFLPTPEASITTALSDDPAIAQDAVLTLPNIPHVLNAYKDKLANLRQQYNHSAEQQSASNTSMSSTTSLSTSRSVGSRKHNLKLSNNNSTHQLQDLAEQITTYEQRITSLLIAQQSLQFYQQLDAEVGNFPYEITPENVKYWRLLASTIDQMSLPALLRLQRHAGLFFTRYEVNTAEHSTQFAPNQYGEMSVKQIIPKPHSLLTRGDGNGDLNDLLMTDDMGAVAGGGIKRLLAPNSVDYDQHSDPSLFTSNNASGISAYSTTIDDEEHVELTLSGRPKRRKVNTSNINDVTPLSATSTLTSNRGAGKPTTKRATKAKPTTTTTTTTTTQRKNKNKKSDDYGDSLFLPNLLGAPNEDGVGFQSHWYGIGDSQTMGTSVTTTTTTATTSHFAMNNGSLQQQQSSWLDPSNYATQVDVGDYTNQNTYNNASAPQFNSSVLQFNNNNANNNLSHNNRQNYQLDHSGQQQQQLYTHPINSGANQIIALHNQYPPIHENEHVQLGAHRFTDHQYTQNHIIPQAHQQQHIQHEVNAQYRSMQSTETRDINSSGNDNNNNNSQIQPLQQTHFVPIQPLIPNQIMASVNNITPNQQQQQHIQHPSITLQNDNHLGVNYLQPLQFQQNLYNITYNNTAATDLFLQQQQQQYQQQAHQQYQSHTQQQYQQQLREQQQQQQIQINALNSPRLNKNSGNPVQHPILPLFASRPQANQPFGGDVTNNNNNNTTTTHHIIQHVLPTLFHTNSDDATRNATNWFGAKTTPVGNSVATYHDQQLSPQFYASQINANWTNSGIQPRQSHSPTNNATQYYQFNNNQPQFTQMALPQLNTNIIDNNLAMSNHNANNNNNTIQNQTNNPQHIPSLD